MSLLCPDSFPIIYQIMLFPHYFFILSLLFQNYVPTISPIISLLFPCYFPSTLLFPLSPQLFP